MLCQIKDGTVSLGGETVLSHFEFIIKGREHLALVGENGSGKTTLCRLLAGELSLDADDGREQAGFYRSRSFTTGMLHQKPSLHPERTLWEEHEAAISLGQAAFPEKGRAELEKEFAFWMRKLGAGELLARCTSRSGEEVKGEIPKGETVGSLSGGEQTKLALAALFLQRPELLILDEPTNHLDEETTETLEQILKKYQGALLVVSHDRFFMDQVAEGIYECREKRLFRFAGNYSAYVKERSSLYERQKKAWDQWREETEKKERLIERFKRRPRKAAMTRAKKKELQRLPEPEKPPEAHAPVRFPGLVPEKKGSRLVWQIMDGKIGYRKESGAGEKVLIREADLRILRGKKIGILGRNGTGKSTFLRTVLGECPLLSGKAGYGEGIETGYFEQQLLSRMKQEEELTVLEHFRRRFPALLEEEARGTLARYLFRGREAGKRIASLSGGERSRLFLAELLQECPNFLLLDEPDNHMDLASKENLEAALMAYEGTLLFVTHDRYFLKEVAESLLVVEDQKLSYYPFGYEHYLAHRNDLGGEGMAARIQKENQALLAGLKAVPEKEQHELPLSAERLAKEWTLEGLCQEIEEAALRWERAEEEKKEEKREALRCMAEGLPVPADRDKAELSAALDAWTQACCRWWEEKNDR